MHPSRLLCLALLAPIAAAAPATARAQATPAATPSPADLAAGRAHFDRGVALFRQQDYDAALAEFLRARELTGRATVLFNIAASYQALHRYPEALEALRAFVRDATSASAARRAEAATALRELEALIARVLVRVEPAGANVTLDGRALGALAASGREPALVGPGRHVVEAAVEGYRTAREEVVIASGETREVRLALAREEAAPPAPPPAPVAAAAPTEPARAAHASLLVTGAPPDATVAIDHRARAVSERIELPAGRYDVVVSAPGMRAWRGEVALTAGGARALRVALVPDRRALAPHYFAVAATGTGVLAAAAVTCGALTASAHAEFEGRTRDDPEARAIGARGQALAVAADVLGVVAIAAGVTAVVLATRTEFVPQRSRAEVTAATTAAVVPALAPGHAGAAVFVRF